MTNKEKVLTLTSPSQIVTLFRNHPALYDIPSLSALKTAISDSPKVKKANCKTCTKETVLPGVNIKTQTEVALSNLTTSDYQKIKELLKIDKLCYYKTVDGKSVPTYI